MNINNEFYIFRIPYLKATVLEIIRMGNIVPVPAPRCATRDIQIRDYIIPKVSLVMIL